MRHFTHDGFKVILKQFMCRRKGATKVAHNGNILVLVIRYNHEVTMSSNTFNSGFMDVFQPGSW